VKNYSRHLLIGRLAAGCRYLLSHPWLDYLTALRRLPFVGRRGLDSVRKEYRRSAVRDPSGNMIASDSALASLQRDIGARCNECGVCQKNCTFLGQYGTPKSIVENFDFSLSKSQAVAYQCSLCGLCTAVCSEKLDPASLFLEVRRRCVEDGNLDEAAYRTMLGYEKLGSSPLFSWFGIPEGCDTIFFPGCTLPGTRPAVTTELYRRIQEIIPTTGIVFNCCTKPSHDLGRTEYFHSLFDEMHTYLVGRGIRTVLTACPSCTKIWRQYGHGLTVRTVYEAIKVRGEAAIPAAEHLVTVHDPCALRDDLPTHLAVRAILASMGHTLAEMEHSGKRTLCCGEGGMVSSIKPKRAGEWALMRSQEAAGRRIVTYCAGCSGYLNRVVPTIYLADLLCRPGAAFSGNLKIARAPFSYWHRLRLKHRMKKQIQLKAPMDKKYELFFNGP
jgi:Fe-S oxidoreductase